MKKFHLILSIVLLSSGFLFAQSPECEENVDANNETVITDNTIQASKNITIARKLYDLEKLKITSGEVIELLPGFENEYGASIEAEIAGCQTGDSDPCLPDCRLIGIRNPSEEQCCFEWLDNQNINTSIRWVCPDMTTTYTLKVIKNNGTTEEISYTVEVENVEFTANPYYLCEGESSVELALTENYETYAWAEKVIGDDEPFISTASTFTVSAVGTYGVTVTNADGCELTGEVKVEEAESPVIQLFPADPLICTPDPEINLKSDEEKRMDCVVGSTTLEVTGEEGNTYAWSNGETEPINTVTEGGEYTVDVTNSEGCTSTGSIVVEEGNCDLEIQPNPAFFCEGDRILLKTTGPNKRYKWTRTFTTSDGTMETEEVRGSTPNIFASASGIYTVKLETPPDNCDPEASAEVTEIITPEPTIVPNPAVICGNPLILSVEQTYDNYLWKGGERDGTNATYEVDNAGTYTLEVFNINPANNKSCGIVSTTITVTEEDFELPMISAMPPILCGGQAVTLDAGEGYGTYLWEWTVNGTMMTSNQQIIEVDEIAEYKLTVSTGNCTEMTSIEISDKPTIIAEPPVICNNTLITLDAGSGFATYNWEWTDENGNTTDNFPMEQTIQINQPGVYTVNVTTNDGCSASNSITIESINLTNLTITPSPNPICMDDASFTLDVGEGYDDYEWATPEGDKMGHMITGSQFGTYSVVVSEDICKGNAEITIQPLDLVIHNGLEGASGGQEISEGNEESVGAVTVANKNDTDGDGDIDSGDNSVVESATGRNEIDLMKLIIKMPQPNNGGNVTLNVESGDVAFWEESTKEVKITDLSFPVEEGDKTIYVEVLSESSELRDISIKGVYDRCEDVVKATGVWVMLTNVWGTDGTRSSTPDPSSLPMSGGLQSAIESNRAFDSDGSSSLYGFGDFPRRRENSDGSTEIINAIGGRVLFEFRVLPTNVAELGVIFDLSRQKEGRAEFLPRGESVMRIITFSSGNTGLFNYPENPDPTGMRMDIEKPNDDDNSRDEDRTPSSGQSDENKNGLIYSRDIPSSFKGTTVINGTENAFRSDRINFREFARVKLSGQFPSIGGNGKVEGSRASNMELWKWSQFLRRNSDGTFSLAENQSTVYCDPFWDQQGNGTVDISIMPSNDSNDNARYSGTYNSENDTWDITCESSSGNSTITLTSTLLSGVKQWNSTICIAGITIKEGSVPFENGDNFLFYTQNKNGIGDLLMNGNF